MSLLDVILELPLAEMLERVPISQEIKAALLGEPSSLAAPLNRAGAGNRKLAADARSALAVAS